MRSLRSISHVVFVAVAILSNKKLGGCSPITNSDLNDRIREFSSKSDINSTVKTLQKEESGRYVNLVPFRNPVRFKDVSDSALSSSSHSRGLLHEHPGYTLHEYEETPPYGYEYHIPEAAPPGFLHHAPVYHHGPHGGQHHFNYHHKHYDHALAAKAFLWPIAGIALLGAAAALVSNPVLLQLGVVSGRRKRRDTEENFEPDLDTKLGWLKNKNDETFDKDSEESLKKRIGKKQANELSFLNTEKSHNDDSFKHRLPNKVFSVKQGALFKKLLVQRTVPPVDVTSTTDSRRRFYRSNQVNDRKLVSVPLIFKENN